MKLGDSGANMNREGLIPPGVPSTGCAGASRQRVLPRAGSLSPWTRSSSRRPRFPPHGGRVRGRITKRYRHTETCPQSLKRLPKNYQWSIDSTLFSQHVVLEVTLGSAETMVRSGAVVPHYLSVCVNFGQPSPRLGEVTVNRGTHSGTQSQS